MPDFESESFIKDAFIFFGCGRDRLKHCGSVKYSRDKVIEVHEYIRDREVLGEYLNMDITKFRKLLYKGNLFGNILYRYKDNIDIGDEIKICEALRDDILKLKKRWFGSKDSIMEIEDILYKKVCFIYDKLRKYINSKNNVSHILAMFVKEYEMKAIDLRYNRHPDRGGYSVYDDCRHLPYVFIYEYAGNILHYYQ